jgi:hypothetical protein
MLDSILYAIIAAFIGWESVAHFVLHNVQGHTASNRVTWLEHQGPHWLQLLVRAIVAAAVLALGVHLEGGF